MKKLIMVIYCILIGVGMLIGLSIANTTEQKKYIEIISELTKTIDSLNDKNNHLFKLLEEKKVITATITAYSPHVNQTDDSPYTTAFLKSVKPGIVAVSRPIIQKMGWAPGQKIYIEGIGIKEIGDLMNKRFTGFRVDVFMWQKKDAIKFGIKKNVHVFLID